MEDIGPELIALSAPCLFMQIICTHCPVPRSFAHPGGVSVGRDIGSFHIPRFIQLCLALFENAKHAAVGCCGPGDTLSQTQAPSEDTSINKLHTELTCAIIANYESVTNQRELWIGDLY